MMFRLIPCTMGANASQLEKDIGSDLFPANEHYFGLVSQGELATALLCILICWLWFSSAAADRTTSLAGSKQTIAEAYAVVGSK